MTVTNADKTKLEMLLTLHPEANIIIKNKRLIQYERIVEWAMKQTLPVLHAQEISYLVQHLRSLEPSADEH